MPAAGKLKLISASRKKRAVVLRWLMRHFSGGQHYSEAEVNAAIQELPETEWTRGEA